MRVLVFGDSIAQGFWSENGGWVNKLWSNYTQQYVDGKNTDPPTVFNLGISGDTTAQIIKRFTNETEARVWPGEEFCIVFATGINDTLYRNDEFESSAELYRQELIQLHELATKYTNKILFVGLTPVQENLVQPFGNSSTGKSYNNERIKEFDIVLQKFTEEHAVTYVPVFDAFQTKHSEINLLPDGLHPNDDGHALIAELVLSQLNKLMKIFE